MRETSATPAHFPVVIQPPTAHETDHRVAGRERTVAIRAALNAAIVAAILTTLPFGFIVGMPLGGFLAVYFYRRRSWRAEPTSGAGFKLGAIAGLFASAIFGIVVAAMLTVSNQAAELHRQIIERFHVAESRATDPQQKQVIEFLMTPQALRVEMIVSAVLMAIVFVVLSGIGGAVAASLLHRKGPKA